MSIETFSVASDFHGDRHDPVARAAFKTFVADFKPKTRWFAGDLFDFRALRIGADREEKMHSMESDFQTGIEFLEEYRPTVVTWGNHDQRLFDAASKDGLNKTGPIADLARRLIAELDEIVGKLKIKTYEWDKRKGVHRYNGLAMVHGFDGSDPGDMAQMYGNVVFGHGHQIVSQAAKNTETKVGRQIGSLALRDMVYNRGQTGSLRQQNGFAYGHFLSRGRFALMQAEIIDGQFSYAKNIVTVKH